MIAARPVPPTVTPDTRTVTAPRHPDIRGTGSGDHPFELAQIAMILGVSTPFWLAGSETDQNRGRSTVRAPGGDAYATSSTGPL